MRTLFLLCAALAGAAPSLAQPALPAPGETAQGDIAVTIYNDNLALVQDVRQLNILPLDGRGRNSATFPARSGPRPFSFGASDTAIVEQNFDYDLLSPSKLMEKAVGKTVTIVRMKPGDRCGNLARSPRSSPPMAEWSCRSAIASKLLRDDGLPGPGDLRPRSGQSSGPPDAFRDGRKAATRGRVPQSSLILTPGLGWKSDYVALFDEGAGKIDVQGWITLTNNTGTNYTNADVVMVAERRTTAAKSRLWRVLSTTTTGPASGD
jgi:hypothetical protein